MIGRRKGKTFFPEGMNKLLIVLLTVASLPMTSRADHAFRWHRYADNSMLLDDDEHGQRLIMPEDVQAAERIAYRHYGEVNPDSFSPLRKGFQISLDIPPRHILTSMELGNWTKLNSTTWWQDDLLNALYRRIEDRATGNAREDPQRAQAEIAGKRATENLPDPPPELVRTLAEHNVHYRTKIVSYDGARSWRFSVNDPHSSRLFEIPVPVGSSEKAIMNAIYQFCLGDSTTFMNGKRVLSQSTKEELSWVRW